MISNKDFHFIKNKIIDTGQAVVYKYIDETHKQIIGIKQGMIVDEKGQIYFSLLSPFERKYIDDIFPVELFFYKKGNPFYVTVKGIAEKWNNHKKCSDDTDIICIKMDEAEYSQLTSESILAYCFKWLKSTINLHKVQGLEWD